MKAKKEIVFDLKEPYVFNKRKIPRHISYNPSYWLFNKQYFFKYSKYAQFDTGEIIGEILVSRLCKELGVDCVDCGYAINRHRKSEYRGVLSKSFLSGEEKAITLSAIRDREIMKDYPKELYFQMMVIFARICPMTALFKYKDLHVIAHNLLYKYRMESKLLMPFDKKFIEKNKVILEGLKEKTKTEKFLTVDECERRIELFAKENGLKIADDTRFKLQQMAIIDAITKQYDRHAGNISVIYDEKQKTARIAPMYDNGLSENYALDSPILDYPKQVNCYIKLEESDFQEINNKETKISQFYKSVCDYYNGGDVEKLFKSMKEEFCAMDAIKAKQAKDDDKIMFEREKTNGYWDDARMNYKKGLEYLDAQISSSPSCKRFVEGKRF